MSDLQCPATFLLVPADAEPAGLERALAGGRFAEVVSGSGPGSVGLAGRLAAAWGLPGPVEADVDATSYREVLAGLADLRRGETTVVVVDAALLAGLAGRGLAGGAGPVEVQVDADGWVVRDWAEVRGGAAAG